MRNYITTFFTAMTLLFSTVALSEVYFTRNVNGTYSRPTPQPILPASNQTVTLVSGSPPPVIKYYVRRQFTSAGKKIFKYVEAPKQPLVLAPNQTLTYANNSLETQQGYANQTNPPVPPPAPVDPEDQTPTLYTKVLGPPGGTKYIQFCRGEAEICDTIPAGVKATVWYGAGSSTTYTWHKRTYVQGPIPCNASSFGGTNPTGNSTYKRCFWINHTMLDKTRLDNKGVNLAPVINKALNPTFDPGLNFFSSRPSTATFTSGDIGAFRIACAPSHIGDFDPIVFPGLDGASHQHIFFANQGITANTTPENIRLSGNGTCAGGIANRSGYWVPSLIDITTGRAQKPDGIVLYYKTSANPSYNLQITTPPPGLRMIAGNARPLAITDSSGDYFCQDQTSVNTPPNYGVIWQGNSIKAGCGDPTGGKRYKFRMTVSFPTCWDGVNLDSPDHKSHMAFACEDCDDGNGGITKTINGCPASHPVLIPNIGFNVDYYLDKNTKDYRLSSDNYSLAEDGGYSSHGDWMNGWQAGILERVVNNCLKPSKDCGGPDLGDGEKLTGFSSD